MKPLLDSPINPKSQPPHAKDKQRKKDYLNNSEKKRLMKLRKQGIVKKLSSSIKPEMAEYQYYDAQSSLSPEDSLHIERLSTFFRTQNLGCTQSVVDQGVYYLKTLTSFLIKLSLCTDWTSAIKVMSLIILDSVKSSSITNIILSQDTLMPESGVFDPERWRKGISDFRDNSSLLKDTPAYSVIKKTLIVLVFTGITDQVKMSSHNVGKLLLQMFGSVDKQTDIGELTFFDACLEIMEFSLSTISCFQSGNNLYNFLMPKSAVARLHELRGYLTPYKQGSIVRAAGMTPEEYVTQVKQLEVELGMIVASNSAKGSVAALHSSNYSNICKLVAEVETFQYSTKYRIQPLCIVIYGKPGVGKSDIAFRIAATISTVLGKELTQDKIYYFKENDNFDSGLRNDHQFYFYDDIGGHDYSNSDPMASATGQMIHTINNVPSPSHQAELENKGKIFHLPSACIGTSNFPSGGFEYVTRNIAALKRRIRFVETRVVPEYSDNKGAVDPSKSVAVKGDRPPVNEFRWYSIDTIGKSVSQVNTGEWMCASKFFRELGDLSRKHYREQKDYVHYQNSQYSVERCPCCGQTRDSSWCECTPEEIEMSHMLNSATVSDAHPVMAENFFVDNLMNSDLTFGILTWIVDQEWILPFVTLYYYLRDLFVPRNKYLWLEKLRRVFLRCLYSVSSLYFLAILRGSFMDYVNALLVSTVGTAVSTVVTYPALELWPYDIYISVRLVLAFTLWVAYIWFNLYLLSRQLLIADNDRRIIEGNGRNPVPLFFVGLLSVVAIYKALKPYFVASDIKPETLAPQDFQDVKDRKEEKDQWLVPTIDQPPAVMELKSMTLEQVTFALGKNLVRVTLYKDGFKEGKSISGQMFFLTNRIVILPKHIGNQPMWHVLGTREPDPTQRGNTSRFSTILYDRREIPDTDFCLYLSTKAQPLASTLKYFALDIAPKASSAVMRTMTDTGYVDRDIWWSPSIVSNGAETAPGSSYTMKIPTQSGDCISPIVSRDKPHICLGFHMGGNKMGKGVGFSLTSEQISKILPAMTSTSYDPEVVRNLVSDEAESSFSGLSIVEEESSIDPEMDYDSLESLTDDSSATEIEPTPWVETRWKLDTIDKSWRDFSGYGSPSNWIGIPKQCADNTDGSVKRIVELENDIHFRSCVNFLKYDYWDPPSVSILGYDPRFITKPTSRVKTSILSPELEKLGFPNKWGPPPFRSGKNHSQYLTLGANSIKPIDPRILDVSCRDYFYGVVDEFERIEYPTDCGPISLYHALNGVEGDRFIKPIDTETSAGLGYGKKKKHHVIIRYIDADGNVTEDGRGKKIITASDHLRTGVQRVLDDLVNGHFESMFVKSALKDEPSQGKVRIFGVLSLDFLLVGKMLFAQVASGLLSIPYIGEMYQGINTVTSDWTDMYNHIIAFEPSQIGEGDYSKYDTSISGQLIRAVGDVLVNVARYQGYSEIWLKAMIAYIESIALNAWVFNGAIFIVDGWNPSGNWLTAVIAGLGNALLHRCAFYSYVKRPLRFRDFVHLATLGDDSLFSTTLPQFNCVTIQRYFASIGMKYTPASKSGEIVPFVEPQNATFGKRTWRWEPMYGYFVAPLAIDSIFKSLHNYMESPTDPITIAVGVVDQALIEFSRHGKREFALYQRILQKCCRKVGIDHMVGRLYQSYDDIIKDSFERQFSATRRVPPVSNLAAMECSILLDEQEL